MTMTTVSFHTFGCKLNQAETASLAQEFEDHGYRIVGNGRAADVVVLNTCTVTARSDAKCRQAIRHAIALNPSATVIVVGCYSQVAADEISHIGGVDYVLGSEEKFRIFDHFPGPGKLSHPSIHIAPVGQLKKTSGKPGHYFNHTRAFLKIQDGCSHRCSYCIVPLARGPSRSIPAEEVMQQASTLIQRGYQEIVLTGVHIGMYGRDLKNGHSLPRLLKKLLALQKLRRLRLSSLDPEEITEELLEVVKSDERICRHFHIPLQSGSDAVLSAMNRQYTTLEFQKKLEILVSEFGDVGLGTDIIAGFPGESEHHFEETCRFIHDLPFTYLHVFPFSPRRGTRAFTMPNPVEPKIRMERAAKLRALGERKKKLFMEKWTGRKVEVLLEARNLKGWMQGFSSHYLRVEVPYHPALKNQLVLVKVEKVLRTSVRGTPITP